MPRYTKTLTKIGAICCAATLAVAACNSAEDEGAAPEPSESQTSAAPEPEPSEEPSEPEPSEPDSPDASEPEPSPSDSPSDDEQTALPTDAVAYADALIIAWGSGDEKQMQQLAADEVIATLEDYGAAGGPHWDQTAHDAGAGSTFVTYENTEDGTTVDLRIANEMAANGEEHAVVEAKFNN